MIVDPDFLDHWRTRMLVDALGGDEMAPMYVMRLWAHCQVRRGDRFTMPAAGVKALCKAACDADALEKALIDAQYIKRDGDGIEVLKWAEHNASLLAAWENGGRGGRPPKQPKQNPRVTEQKPMANPDETHGEPIREEKREEVSKATPSHPPAKAAGSKLPTIPCPYDAIVAAYHEALPALPAVRLMDGKTWEARQKAMRSMWAWVLTSRRPDQSRRATSADEAMQWFRDYFARASQNDFVMGRTQRDEKHKNWRADLDYLLTESGMRQVIEKTLVDAA